MILCVEGAVVHSVCCKKGGVGKAACIASTVSGTTSVMVGGVPVRHANNTNSCSGEGTIVEPR